MQPSVLLTGFDPFPGVPRNPSGEIVSALDNDPGVIGAVLTTAFVEAGENLASLIRVHRPDAVLMLGVAAGRDAINLERFALNINDATKPDNAGVLAQGQPIEPDGPVAYASTLPLRSLYDALTEREIPVTYSNHAGAYVCNHVFYVARHTVETLGVVIPAGFIHIPMMSDDPEQPGAENGLALDTMIEAIRICIQVCQNEPKEIA